MTRELAPPLLVSGRYPRAAGWGLAVAEALLDGPREVAVVGPGDDPATRALVRVARRATAPGMVLAVGDPVRDPADGPADEPADEPGVVVALLADRPLDGGRPTAYVCRQFVCERPTTDPGRLATQLTPGPS